MIEQSVGAITQERYLGGSFPSTPEGEIPVYAIEVEYPTGGSDIAGFFVFCNGVLAAYWTPVSQPVAHAIAEDVQANPTGDSAGPARTTIHDDSVGILLDEGRVSPDCLNLAGPRRSIDATELLDVFTTREFYDLCGGPG